MTELLKGKDVVEALNQRLAAEVKTLISAGVTPTLALVRVGENPGDLAYERGAKKRAEAVGVTTLSYVFPQEVSQEELMEAMVEINGRKDIHGALIFRPLPGHLDEEEIRMTLDPAKDVDGITDGSMAGVYSHRALGFPPCTAEACMEILDHYGIALEGKKAVVLGRSLVIGKPVAMMLMAKNATVTLCHSKTQNPEALAKDADILIAAMGRGRSVGAEYFHKDQVIIDVGINVDEAGNLCGDVDTEEAMDKVAKITPVPGGVGTVTASLLMKHVIEAAKNQ